MIQIRNRPRCVTPDAGPRQHGSRSLGLLSLGCLVALACFTSRSGIAEAAEPTPMKGVELIEAWPDSEWEAPVFVTHAGDGTDMLYVIEQSGRIKMIQKYRGSGPVPRASVFLDLRRVIAGQKAQGGLLGLAFHPQYKTNKKIYVSFVTPHDNPAMPSKKLAFVLAEFQVTNGRVSVASRRDMIRVPKRFPMHQAGCLGFRPEKGVNYLYISIGDGGAKNDADGNAQSPARLMGKILRIDVDGRSPGLNYKVPESNPWATHARSGRVRGEIWAYGFRNPWRFWWDTQGRMWTVEPGTTGPQSNEWLTQVVRGGNHGWPYFAGPRRVKTTQQPPRGIVRSTFSWTRGKATGSAGVGGATYTGSRVRALKGKFIIGDYMRGEVYALTVTGNGTNTRASNWQKIGDVPELASICQDAQGELYFCANDIGTIMTLTTEK